MSKEEKKRAPMMAWAVMITDENLFSYQLPCPPEHHEDR